MTTSGVGEIHGWGRRRLLATFAIAATASLILLAALGYAVYVGVAQSPRDTARGQIRTQSEQRTEPENGQAHRDAVAAAPMLQVTPQDARQGRPVATPAPTILIPASTSSGPVRVPSGFPRTPEGAIGQLAAIESTVLDGMSIAQATAVYAAWALPGGVGAASWELIADVQAFLEGASVSQAQSGAVAVAATPAGAQVKGTDGGGWVLACVLMDVRAAVVTVAEIGYGYCERMQWVGAADGRWMIAPGEPAARAPSTWPGTELSIQAGWRAWAAQGGE